MKMKKKISMALSFVLVFTMLFGTTGVFANDVTVPVEDTQVPFGCVPIAEEQVNYEEQIAMLNNGLQVSTNRMYIDEVWINKIFVQPIFYIEGKKYGYSEISSYQSYSKSSHSGYYVPKSLQDSLIAQINARGYEVNAWYVKFSYQVAGSNAVSITHQTTDTFEVTEYISSPKAGSKTFDLSLEPGSHYSWKGYLTYRNSSNQYATSAFLATISFMTT